MSPAHARTEYPRGVAPRPRARLRSALLFAGVAASGAFPMAYAVAEDAGVVPAATGAGPGPGRDAAGGARRRARRVAPLPAKRAAPGAGRRAAPLPAKRTTARPAKRVASRAAARGAAPRVAARRRRPRAEDDDGGISAAYRRMRDGWHEPPSPAELRRWKRQNPRPLVLVPVAGSRRFSITPDRRGRFDADALREVSAALAARRGGGRRAVHPRLVEVLYRAVKHFEVPYVHVISGYRADRATSRHTQGRAVDIVLPGVSNDRLARFLRKQGYVGVGVYPVSGFVHVDVRSRSYFWTDLSGPGETTRPRTVRTAEAESADRGARRRREEAVPDLDVEGTDVPAPETAPATDPEASGGAVPGAPSESDPAVVGDELERAPEQPEPDTEGEAGPDGEAGVTGEEGEDAADGG